MPILKRNLVHVFESANITPHVKIQKRVDVRELKNILKKLNFVEKIKIKKMRWSAKKDEFTICIDSIKQLGLFVEIEVKDERIFERFKKMLPFHFKEIRHGYTELYAKEVLKIEVPDFKNNFKNNPDWNFLKGQKELISHIIKNQRFAKK